MNNEKNKAFYDHLQLFASGGTAPKVSKNKSVKKSEIGSHGTSIFAGIIDEEYNTLLLSNEQRCTIYDEALSDPSVFASVKTVQLPITSAKYDVNPASNSTRDRFIANFVHHCLFEAMDKGFVQLIKDILLSLVFGYAPFEIVEKVEAYNFNNRNYNTIKLKKLAFRHPKTIEKWEYDDVTNTFQGYWQRIPTNNKLVLIPMKDSVVFTNEQVGDNIEGKSILRPVLKPWKYKEAFYKVEGIGIERNAIGIPVLYLQDPTGSEIEDGKKLVKSIVVHEEMGLVLDKEFNDFKFMTGGIDSVAIHKAIAHHDSKIFIAVFAGFLQLGQESRGGSRALGDSLIQFFLMGIRSYLDSILDQLNNVIVKRLVDKNFTNVKKYPKVTANLGTIGDKKAWADIFSAMFKEGIFIKHDLKQMQDAYNKIGIEYNEDELDKYVNDLKKKYQDSLNAEKEMKENMEKPLTNNPKSVNIESDKEDIDTQEEETEPENEE